MDNFLRYQMFPFPVGVNTLHVFLNINSKMNLRSGKTKHFIEICFNWEILCFDSDNFIFLTGINVYFEIKKHIKPVSRKLSFQSKYINSFKTFFSLVQEVSQKQSFSAKSLFLHLLFCWIIPDNLLLIFFKILYCPDLCWPLIFLEVIFLPLSVFHNC